MAMNDISFSINKSHNNLLRFYKNKKLVAEDSSFEVSLPNIINEGYFITRYNAFKIKMDSPCNYITRNSIKEVPRVVIEGDVIDHVKIEHVNIKSPEDSEKVANEIEKILNKKKGKLKMKKLNKNYAFIDGSFNPTTKIYGCGGFLVDQFGKKHIIQSNGNDKNMAKMRNVAGEILGAVKVVELAQKLGMKKVTIFHDYEGIAAWPLGKWKCKKVETRKYAMIIWNAMELGLKIYFSHVKGHSGIDGNEEADQLAKLAVGLEVK